MHVAPHRNRPCQPTLAKTFDSLVALTMERFNGPPKSVYQKGFSADFCEQNSFSESKSPAWAEDQGASPRVLFAYVPTLALRCRRKGGQYAVRCSGLRRAPHALARAARMRSASV